MKQTNIEKLIEWLEEELNLTSLGQFKLGLTYAYMRAKQLQQEEPSGWISVGTELPSKMGLYLIYDENYGKPYTSTLRFTYTKKWINDSGDEFHPQYWQPLPNKPKR